MKPIKLSKAVLCALSVTYLGGCAMSGFWDRHQGTQSAPYPDQAYWQERTWRQDIARQQREDDRRLSKVRLGEFIR